jgi:hypothetical protein
MNPDFHVHCLDLRTLIERIEASHRNGEKITRRMQEIWTACFFALCLEHNEGTRFLMGFPERGQPDRLVPLKEIFSGKVGELDDWDIVLVPDSGPDGPIECEIHQCQLVSYQRRQNPSTEDLIAFLEEKKLRKAAGGDLRLVVSLDQATSFHFDWVAISMHLMTRSPACPYQQVSMFGNIRTPEAPLLRCRQVFPRMLPLRDLDMQTVRNLLQDRPTYPTLKRL